MLRSFVCALSPEVYPDRSRAIRRVTLAKLRSPRWHPNNTLWYCKLRLGWVDQSSSTMAVLICKYIRRKQPFCVSRYTIIIIVGVSNREGGIADSLGKILPLLFFGSRAFLVFVRVFRRGGRTGQWPYTWLVAPFALPLKNGQIIHVRTYAHGAAISVVGVRQSVSYLFWMVIDYFWSIRF